MSPIHAEPEFPVQRKFKSANINSKETEIIIQDFSNRSLIFISQCDGKLGSFVEVNQDKPSFDHFNPESNTFSIRVLFGADTENILLSARIFTAALTSTDRPILFSIALKDFSKENLFAIRDLLSEVVKN